MPELPGCFASGDSIDELAESLREGIVLYLGLAADATAVWTDGVQERKLAVSG